ncbi:probable GH family 25 lysozyme 2 [Oscarella lobularis]|uniref:probable GH family 25 lysozyme 2 n=1 Tax=Oscarella lobularis TaxID=121494 RepID=UPI003314260F
MTSSVIILGMLFCHLAYSMPVNDSHGVVRNESFSGSYSGQLGVDVSTSVSKSVFECLKSNGYSYAIVRAHYSGGGVDKNAAPTIANAWAGGMSHVDAYLFPCYRCGDPAGQVSQTVDYLKEQGTRYGTLWLDIERNDWSSDKSLNQKFFKTMFDTARFHKATGVYTSQYQWGEIMGNDYTEGHSAPLWYPHYDNNPSFSDFEPFGGWSKPAIKQYDGNAFVCGAGIDKNYYP